jgi:hypothetical protein
MQNLHILISTVALVLWLFVGGAGLNQIEQTAEVARTKSYCDKRAELIRLYQGDATDIESAERAVVGGSTCRVIRCDIKEESNWSFLGATFFSLTVFTSIGYGTYVPVTQEGKAFTIVYAVIGIVMFAYVQANMHRMIFHFQTSGKKRTHIFLLVMNCSCLALWMAVMAGYYSVMESWTYGDGLWFSFITVTTIGYGDFAPTKTRDSLMNYFFILGGIMISGVCVDDLIRLFYIEQIADKSVSVNARGIDGESEGPAPSGWCCLGNKVYLCLRQPLDMILDRCVQCFGGSKKAMEWRAYILAHWLVIIIYMFFGGAFFNLIEMSGGGTDKATAIAAWRSMKESKNVLVANLKNASAVVISEDIPSNLAALSRLVKSGNVTQSVILEVQEGVSTLMTLLNAAGTCPEPVPLSEKWNVVNAAMFCMTTFTTIGYGNITPETGVGKSFCVVYTIVGFIMYAKVESATVIWLNLGLTAATNKIDYFVSKICCCCGEKTRALEYFIVAVSSGVFYMIVAALLFMCTEEWDFLSAFWFSFISSFTIGLGDSTPSFEGWNFLIEGMMLSLGLTHMAMCMHVTAQYSAKWLACLCGSHEKHVGHHEKSAVEVITEVATAPATKLVI